MKIARILHENKEVYAIVEGDRLRLAEGSPFTKLEPTSASIPLEGARLLAPCVPGKALCVGLNYRDHAAEFGHPIPESPVIFIKPTSALIGPLDAIVRPALSHRVDYEAELVAVIGRKAKNVSAAEALDYVLGYTCGNDVTARDLQPKNGQWTISKSFDTFLSIGPWIETELDSSSLDVAAYLNGERKQHSSTGNLIFPVPELIAYLSSVMTLEPGDIIMTGTPSGVGPMKENDEIAIEIEGIGRLLNKVR